MCPVSLELQFWTCRSTETPASSSSSLTSLPVGKEWNREKCNSSKKKKKKKEEGELCYAVARSSCLKLSTDGRTSHRLPPSGKLPLLFDVVTLTHLSPSPSDAHLSSAPPLILSRALLSSVVRMARANITHLAPDILTSQPSRRTPSAFILACKLPGPTLVPKLWPPPYSSLGFAPLKIWGSVS